MTQGHSATDRDPGFPDRHRLLILYLVALIVVAALSGVVGERPILEIVLTSSALVALGVAAAVQKSQGAAAVAAGLGIALGSSALVWQSLGTPLSWLPPLIGLTLVASYRRLPPLLAACAVYSTMGLAAMTPRQGMVWSLGVLAVALALILAWRISTPQTTAAEVSDRFQISFEEAPIGMAVLRPSGELVEVNKAMSRILGYDQDHLTGANISGLVHVDDHLELGEAWEQMGNGDQHRATEWMRWLTAGGRPIWARVSLSLVPRTEGQPAL
ncbi:MAG TPA: PAS domain-containing protein, partial [Acidimicrobiia bacterium]|nr:PAS domain-containing protein [Acidimicrobiia bacterium]